MVSHFRDETYGDVKTTGYNVRGRIVRGLNVRGRNVRGRSVPIPYRPPKSEKIYEIIMKIFVTVHHTCPRVANVAVRPWNSRQ